MWHPSYNCIFAAKPRSILNPDRLPFAGYYPRRQAGTLPVQRGQRNWCAPWLTGIQLNLFVVFPRTTFPTWQKPKAMLGGGSSVLWSGRHRQSALFGLLLSVEKWVSSIVGGNWPQRRSLFLTAPFNRKRTCPQTSSEPFLIVPFFLPFGDSGQRCSRHKTAPFSFR